MELQKVIGMDFWIWIRWGQNTEQKFQQSTDEKVELQQNEHFEDSEFYIMDWGYYKRNNGALFLKCK